MFFKGTSELVIQDINSFKVLIILRASSIHHLPQNQQVQEGNPDIPSDTLQLLLGDPVVFPGQMGYKIHPVSSGFASGPPPSWR